MSALWIDAPTGLAGDMLLAALLDLGVDQAVVESPLAALGLAGRYRIPSRRRAVPVSEGSALMCRVLRISRPTAIGRGSVIRSMQLLWRHR
jgi:hypothetical protein